MSALRRLTLALLGLGLLTVLGTAGYVLIERMSLVNALYMTVMTISTVGFGEVVPLSPAGRLYTVVLIVTGVGTGLYLLTQVAEIVLEGRLRDVFGRNAMRRTIDELDSHVILCGFGRFGRAVFEELHRRGEPVVVVDQDPALERDLQRMDTCHLIGSALADETLEEAGIRRARALVLAIASDPDNVFVTLSAREKNPGLRIHARAETEAGARRLRLAGADQVVSAYQQGGQRMAAAILRPSVLDFIELTVPGRGDAIDLEELRVAPGARIVGREVGELEREAPRLRIVGLKRGEDAMVMVPAADMRVEVGDLLVAVGDRDSLDRLGG